MEESYTSEARIAFSLFLVSFYGGVLFIYGTISPIGRILWSYISAKFNLLKPTVYVMQQPV